MVIYSNNVVTKKKWNLLEIKKLTTLHHVYVVYMYVAVNSLV